MILFFVQTQKLSMSHFLMAYDDWNLNWIHFWEKMDGCKGCKKIPHPKYLHPSIYLIHRIIKVGASFDICGKQHHIFIIYPPPLTETLIHFPHKIKSKTKAHNKPNQTFRYLFLSFGKKFINWKWRKK